MAISYPASFMVSFLGIEQPVDMYQIMHYGNDDSMLQYHRLRGMSIKDYMMSMVEIPATEEQMQILFGEHYNDKTEDNPSYEWIKVSVTGEPLNENSVFLDDANAYVTLEFDATVNLKGLSMFEGYGFASMKMGEEGPPEEDLSIEGNLYDIEEYEKEEQDIMLKFGNVLINTLYSGGLQDISYDVYTQKGFHKFDESWKSLEEDMNIPKVVDTYSDLPKSFIENGLMAVANEERKLPEPKNNISISDQGLIAIKPTFSVVEEMERIKQFAIENGAPEDLDWENSDSGFEVGFYDPISDYGFHSYSGYVFNNDMKGTVIVRDINPEEDIIERWYYADEAGAEIELPRNRDTGSSDIFVTTEGGCWYYYEIEDGKDDTYLITSPKKYEGTEPFFISDKSYMCEGIWAGFYSDDFEFDIEPSSYTFGFIDFYDSSKVENYPKGFYQYSNNRWYHQPDIAGASFDNEDVLKKITGEDIGNIDLNTEARHEHYNKSVLDQLPWDSYDKLVNQVPANTSARHTHSNQYYLDQITSSDYVHKHNNKAILDKITSDDNVHTHSNKLVLDSITSADVSNITSNTNARHSHSNKGILDQFSWDTYNNISYNSSARHTHSNKGVLDGISSSTILDISNNKSARHTHANKTVLDSITQTNKDILDKIDNNTLSDISSNTEARHSHSNKNVLDNLTQSVINNSHNHNNKNVLDSLTQSVINNSHAHNNENVLDDLTQSVIDNSHTHSNQNLLEILQLEDYVNIVQNTSARHTHNNSAYLDQINEKFIKNINDNTEARHSHTNINVLNSINMSKLQEISSNTSARHEHNNSKILDEFSIAPITKALLYGNRPITNDFITVFYHINSGVTDVAINENEWIVYDTDYLNITSIPDGTSWLEINNRTKLIFPEEIIWVNGISPPVAYNHEVSDYPCFGGLYDGSKCELYIRLTRGGTGQIFGEWFIDDTFKIDNRLMPEGSNCNFAKIEDGQLYYAPSVLSNKYNDEEVYLTNGYKRVLGQHPIVLSRELKITDECEIQFKEYDDFIIVFWIVTPKGSRIGEYISTSYFDDVRTLFLGYQGRTLDSVVIGELDFSNATKGNYIFKDCINLVSLPEINLSSISGNMTGLFKNCKSLVTIDKLIFPSVTTKELNEVFYGCEKLENILFEGSIKVCEPIYSSLSYSFSLSDSPNLTSESLVSFLNILEDNTEESEQYVILLGSANLEKLTPEQIAIATDKNILLI